MKEEVPNYLINLIPKIQQATKTRINCMPTFHCHADCFKNSFFASTLNDWYKSDKTIRNSESISIFKSRLLSFIRPLKSNAYNTSDLIGLKLLTRLCLDFSQLNEHRFWHNFQDCINHLCSCSLEIEEKSHYLLRRYHFSHYCIDLINSVKSILENFQSLLDSIKKYVLLSGNSRLDGNKNIFIIAAALT